jgi:dihydroflavonol-4-reductase
MPVLVTGASGFIGGHLVRRLCRDGERVRCLVRASSSRAWLDGFPIEWHEADLAGVGDLRAALDGVDVVYHLAGVIRADDEATYLRVNRDGTVRLAAACAEVAPRARFVLLSSLAAAGPGADDRPVDEDSPCRPVTAYGRSKRAGEEAVGSIPGLSWTIVRPPAVYGPRERDIFTWFRMAARGWVPVLAHGGRLSLVHVEDLVEGILRAARSARAEGRVYFIAGDGTFSWDELADALSAAFGRRLRRVRVPPWFLRAAGRCGDLLGTLARRRLVINSEKASEILQKNWTCTSRRANEELGFAPRWNLADGFRDTLEWYRRAGWLPGRPETAGTADPPRRGTAGEGLGNEGR